MARKVKRKSKKSKPLPKKDAADIQPTGGGGQTGGGGGSYP